MLGSKIDLFGNDWLEVVFDQKNKTYGAYQLRRQSNSNTAKALFMAGTLFVLFFLAPKIMSLVNGKDVIDDPIDRIVPVALQPPPAVNPETPLPAVTDPPKSKDPIQKFLPPVVVDKPIDADPVMIKDLAIANPGQKTIEGSVDGDIVINITPGEGPKQMNITEDNKVYEFRSLEVQPVFPGGMDKFYNYLSKAIRYPGPAQENGIQGKVFVSFIIETNGTLTDLKVDRKLGFGTDEEALRVLKGSPKWIPGIQNGRPVRVRYNIPISFSLSQ